MNPLLEKLIAGAPVPNAGGASPNTPSAMGKASPIKKISYNHLALVDYLIANPNASGQELSQVFDLTPSWLSTVIVSDIFQAKLAARREEIIDPELRANVRTQFKGLLERSMEILRFKLDKPPEEVPDQLALQVAKISGQSLGYGNKEVKVTVSETHTHLTELGNNLVGLLRQRKAEALTHDTSTRADFGGRIIDVQEDRTGTNTEVARASEQR